MYLLSTFYTPGMGQRNVDAEMSKKKETFYGAFWFLSMGNIDINQLQLHKWLITMLS